LVLTSSYSLLTILLVSLRAVETIDWPWLWVLSPLWLPVAVVCVVITALGLLGAAGA